MHNYYDVLALCKLHDQLGYQPRDAARIIRAEREHVIVAVLYELNEIHVSDVSENIYYRVMKADWS